MAELRTKVMAGRFKPITPGKYSADLINLMGQLLQVNPQRRPEVSKILASSVVQKHAAGGSHKAAPAEPSSKGNVLQTIKVHSREHIFIAVCHRTFAVSYRAWNCPASLFIAVYGLIVHHVLHFL